MPIDPAKAIAAVNDDMHERRWNVVDLAVAAGLDKGTVGDFLAGTRWPRPSTRGAIEASIELRPGALGRIAEGRSTVEQERPAVTAEPASPVGLGLDDAAEGLAPEQVERIRALILDIKGTP